MYCFLAIRTSGKVLSIDVPGYNLVDAFRRYRRDWWTPDTELVDVFHKYKKVAWVIPAIDMDTGQSVPMLKER